MSDLGVSSPAIEPVPATTLAGHYLVDAARSAARLALRARRTPEKVDHEYDDGHWRQVLEGKAWERSADLGAFLVGSNTERRISIVDGRLARVPVNQYYRYRLDAFAALIRRLSGGGDAIVELGAGYGANLFVLARAGVFDTYRGLDISPNALAAGRAIAAHFGLADKVSFDRIDITDPTDPHFPEIAGKVVLTHFCLEQIPRAIEAAVANILAAGPRRVIQIEPGAELLRRASPRDLVSYLYLRSVDYQNRLFGHLARLESEGRIKVVERFRMPFAPTFHNDGFCIVWEPTQ